MPKPRRRLLLPLVAASVCALQWAGASAWQLKIDGSGSSGRDLARAMTVDGEGNIVAGGLVDNAPWEFTVIKFARDSGTELWRREIRGSGRAYGPDGVLALTVDANGDVLATGSIDNAGSARDFFIVKLAGADGAELWRQVIAGSANQHDRALAVAVDRNGDVVAAGSLDNLGTRGDLFVVKFAGADGVELWRAVISGTAAISFDQATAVAIDPSGNVVAAGVTENAGTRGDVTVVKLAGASGSEIWRRVIDQSASNDAARAVTIDAAGDVLAAGVAGNAFTVIKFGGTNGAELWRRGIGVGSALAVTVNSAAEVVAAGSISEDFTVVKLVGATGAELWRQQIRGTAPGVDEASAVTVDGNGDVAAAGFTQNAGTRDDFTVVKVTGADGTELWRRVISGSLNSSDRAFAVSPDSAGDFAAAGHTANTVSGGDFTVVKLAATTGTALWHQDVNGTADRDVASAVTTDAAGDVVAAGSVENAGTGSDFLVAKFAGVDGTEFWRREINGTADGSDMAYAIAVDANADVVAAGRIENTTSPTGFFVIKFAGVDGTELWRQVIGSAGFGAAYALAVDRNGDIVAAGTGMVVKLAADSGVELWRGAVNGEALAVSLDANGEVVAAGWTEGETHLDSRFTVVKIAGASGAELWRQDVAREGFQSLDSAYAIAVDAEGDMVAGGMVDFNFLVAKFAGPSGTVLWRRRINSPEAPARAVTVDAVGNVVAAGEIPAGFGAVKLAGATGEDVWQQGIGLGQAFGAALDAAGDVLVGGHTYSVASLFDFTVIKLAGGSGEEQWRRIIAGTVPDGNDGVRAIAVDLSGDIVAAGVTQNIGTSTDFTIIKLRGADGSDF